MTRVDLITGFLGAGKTTFIQQYGAWMQGRGIPYAVIENEFGIVNIDSAILRNDGAEVYDLSGGCICCGLKTDFRRLLGFLAEKDVRVVVEPSGVFDPHDFFNIVTEAPLNQRCQLGTVAAIVDPHALDDLPGDVLDMLREQVNCSSIVLMSKTGGMSSGEIAESVERVEALFDGASAGKIGIETRPWDEFSQDDFTRIFEGVFDPSVRRCGDWSHAAFETALVFNAQPFTEQEILERMDTLTGDPRHGIIIRVKGYLKSGDGRFHEVNCTARDRLIRTIETKARPYLTVIGRDLNRPALAELFKDAKVG